jgi:hypothetical protein
MYYNLESAPSTSLIGGTGDDLDKNSFNNPNLCSLNINRSSLGLIPGSANRHILSGSIFPISEELQASPSISFIQIWDDSNFCSTTEFEQRKTIDKY